MPDVVVLGDINVDIVARFARYPEEGGDALAGSHEFHCGGSAANTAQALSWLGRTVRLIARIGLDPWADFALRDLERAGVLLDGLQRDPAVMTGLMYIVVTPGGERTLLGHRGANARTDADQIDERVIAGSRLLHLSGYALLAEPQRSAAICALTLAGRHGLRVSLDPGLALAQGPLDQVHDLLPAVDILLPTLAEARALTGCGAPEDCACALLRNGVGTVVIKLGAAGCLVATAGEFFGVSGFPVEARDTTGAGDSFAAGFLAGQLAGLDGRGAALLGNAMGAVAAGRVGAGTSQPMAGEALEVLCGLQRDEIDPRAAASLSAVVDLMKPLAHD